MNRCFFILFFAFSFTSYCQEFTPSICVTIKQNQSELADFIAAIDARNKKINVAEEQFSISLINRKKRQTDPDKFEICFAKNLSFNQAQSTPFYKALSIKDLLEKLKLSSTVDLSPAVLNKRLFFKEF